MESNKKCDIETFENDYTSLGYTIKSVKDADLTTFESVYKDYSAKLINDKKQAINE